jgi:molybdopterin synthase catalytic subunit
MSKVFVSVQTEDFDLKLESDALKSDSENAGALVIFTGLVREVHQAQHQPGQVQELFLEHYPGMTEKCLNDISEEAVERWDISCARVIHRVGALNPGDQIVLVGTTSAHRGAAFEAAEFIMDYLKTKAPFWKRQTDESGSRWIEHRESDEIAAQRWKR